MKKKSAKEKVEELAAVLEEGVKNFQFTPEEYRAMLEMKAIMPRYSFRNIMVAKTQFPNATYLASLKRWNELGRKVKKGAKAIRIFAPRFKKVEEDGEEKQKLIGFFTVPVFALEQTEGDPLPIDKIKITLEGECPEARRIIQYAEKIAEKDKCNVLYGDAEGANGYYSPSLHKIVVEKSLPINHRAKTLIHELVHSKVHRHIKSSATEREIVAEGAAFIVCSYFGLDTSDYSFRYVYSWKNSRDENPLMKYGTTICDISQRIIEEFEEEQADKGKGEQQSERVEKRVEIG